MRKLERSDTELVLAARGDDGEAYGELFNRWFSNSWNVARTIVRNDEQAADVAQDAMLTAWQRLGQLDNPDAFGGWLLRITRNKALNRLEREQRSKAIGDETVSGLRDQGLPDPTGAERPLTPDSIGEVRDRQELVWAAAAALGERDVSLLDLHLRHGLSPAEIADELGVAANSAHQQLFRLRTKLGDAISSYLLWRNGRPLCEGLAAAVSGDVAFDKSVSRAVTRHQASCDACSDRRESLTDPSKLFAGVPLVLVPSQLKAQAAATLQSYGVPTESAASNAASSGGESANPADPGGGHGGPSGDASGGTGGHDGSGASGQPTDGTAGHGGAGANSGAGVQSAQGAVGGLGTAAEGWQMSEAAIPGDGGVAMEAATKSNSGVGKGLLKTTKAKTLIGAAAGVCAIVVIALLSGVGRGDQSVAAIGSQAGDDVASSDGESTVTGDGSEGGTGSGGGAQATLDPAAPSVQSPGAAGDAGDSGNGDGNQTATPSGQPTTTGPNSSQPPTSSDDPTGTTEPPTTASTVPGSTTTTVQVTTTAAPTTRPTVTQTTATTQPSTTRTTNPSTTRSTVTVSTTTPTVVTTPTTATTVTTVTVTRPPPAPIIVRFTSRPGPPNMLCPRTQQPYDAIWATQRTDSVRLTVPSGSVTGKAEGSHSFCGRAGNVILLDAIGPGGSVSSKTTLR